MDLQLPSLRPQERLCGKFVSQSCSIALQIVWSRVCAHKLINREEGPVHSSWTQSWDHCYSPTDLLWKQEKLCNCCRYFIYFSCCSGIINYCGSHESICQVKILQVLGIFCFLFKVLAKLIQKTSTSKWSILAIKNSFPTTSFDEEKDVKYIFNSVVCLPSPK